VRLSHLERSGDAITDTIQLTDADRLIDAMIRSDNVGPRTFRSLAGSFRQRGPGARAAADLARRGGSARPTRICSEANAHASSPAAENSASIGSRPARPALRRG